jgi:SOS-response transcriptional repressor LexA
MGGVTPEMAGQWIQARRLEKGVRAADIADALHVAPSYYSNYETGKYDLRSNPERLMVVVKALGISNEELREKLGVETMVTEARSLPPGAQAVEPVEAVRVRFLGTVQAIDVTRLRNGGTELLADGETVRCTLDIANRYPGEDLFALKVSGNSMACRKVHKEIPEGCFVLFHRRIEPRPKDIVVAWIPELGLDGEGVLKEMGRPGETFALESYNEEGLRLPAREYPRMEIQGVYLGHWLAQEGRRG